MLNKQIKKISIICICVCVLMLPISGYGLDKEEFLKFLIDSSYPETEEETKEIETENQEVEIENKNTETNSEDKETETNNNDKLKDEDDFFKVYVGEENIPKEVETSENDTETSNQSTSQYLTGYKDNVKVTGDKPNLFIYHTHAGETYKDSPTGNYHSQGNEDKSVLGVGMVLAEYLSNMGWGVIHDVTYNDYPDFNRSYISSLDLIKSTKSKYSGIDIAMDIHRDGVAEQSISNEQERMVTTIDGEEVAKFFLVVGQKNENIEHLDKIAQEITELANKMYPGIAGKIVYKSNGRFNQYLIENQMLIEIGSNGTTSQQAKSTPKYLAKILDEYFKEYK